MTLDMTSTSIAAADMEMQRSAATGPTAADDTTAMKTEWLQNHRAFESLAEQFAACHCQARFDRQPTSPSTTAKPSQSCGWQTSGWHTSWEVHEETIEPSSANYRSSSLTLPADGSRNSTLTRSTTGPIWFGCSKETSRGPTYTPAIHGTSASASRNQENLSESMLDASRSNVLSFRTSPTMMSFWPLSQAPHARIWCGNWVETDLIPSTN